MRMSVEEQVSVTVFVTDKCDTVERIRFDLMIFQPVLTLLAVRVFRDSELKLYYSVMQG